MVIFFECYQTAVDQRSSSGLPMTGEDTGLGALASPLVGYLGKVQERAASLESCPWCSSKGLTYALRSYRINLQESITLCTNPQCLFPLVSRPLEDVLASLDRVEPPVPIKRKHVSALENEEFVTPVHKRLRSRELDSLGPQSVTDALISQTECGAVNVVSNGLHAASTMDVEQLNGYREPSKTTGRESLQDETAAAACGNGFVCPPTGRLLSSSEALLAGGDEPALSLHCGVPATSEAEDDFMQVTSPLEVPNSLNPNQSSFTCEAISSTEINTASPPHNERTARTGQKLLTADVITCKDIRGIKSEMDDLSSTAVMEAEELVSVPSQLFWRNSDSLCWLDSLLGALVACKSLRKYKPKDEPQRSPVWQLMRGYEDVRAAIQAHQQTGGDGVVRVPTRVLQKANADLHSLRMSVFNLLQPKLHCKLGQEETPVFAMPLLLAMDSWAEPLFQSTFHWEFKCPKCKTATTERVVKTLPTFTRVLAEWHPLHAVHLAPCNACCQKSQRTMVLESVPPVFALHFVDGLPTDDVKRYTFTFKQKRYSITTVIKYNHQLKHFSTWICNSDGLWLEYDDLKPDCKTHQKLPLLGPEMHVVFWEVEEDRDSRSCSPSTTFAESPPPTNDMDSLADKDKLSAFPPDQSLLMCHNDTDIVCALSVSDDGMDTTAKADVDASICSTTLLDTFEGLSHKDIVTLTLVEIKVDSGPQPTNGSDHAEDLSALTTNKRVNSSPDSSSTVMGSEVSHCAEVKLIPSDSYPLISATAPPEPSEVLSIEVEPESAAQDDTPTVVNTQQASPVSSSDTTPLSTSLKSEAVPSASARWSFLLSKNPFNHTPVAKPTSVTQVEPTALAHSTPNPVRRWQAPGGFFPKPQLRTEESEGLPLKAADMYGGFPTKLSNTQSPDPSLELLKSKPLQTVTVQTSQKRPPVVSDTSLPVPGAKGLPEIPPSKKHGSLPSKLSGLSETEALRYKLIKKLKAKKKKLAKLNEMLGQQGGASLRPDSTALGSPNTVTSSTYEGSICDDFLSDLLSPATTASNLSPDSTNFLEMLANGQDGGNRLDCGAVNVVGATNTPNPDNFLDEFLSQVVDQRPTEMETEALSALELFH